MKTSSFITAFCAVAALTAESLPVKYEMEQLLYTTEDGRTMNYCRREMNWDQPGKAAVLIFFHGAGERGNDNEKQLFHGAKEVTEWCAKNKMKALLVFPQCPGGKQWVDTPWNAPSHTLPAESESMKLAMELLNEELKSSDLDKNRVYVAGISMGGFGTWDAISRYPEKFAAAFPICGGADLAMADKVKHIPILTYHGDSDTVVLTKRTREMVAAVKKAGGTKITYVEVPDCGHNSWSTAFGKEDNWKWLFEQKKELSAWQAFLAFFGL